MNGISSHEVLVKPGALPPIPLSGVLCGRRLIVLGWPEAHEFDLITRLRNMDNVRRWFLDDRPLDPEANRVWLANLDRPWEALLAIRLAADGRFLGMIGWSKWDPQAGTATIGRLALDRRAVKYLLQETSVRGSIALDAAIAIRDFVFASLGVQRITTWYISGNALSARVIHGIGMTETGRRLRERPDGRLVETIELVMDRESWLVNQQPKELAALAANEAGEEQWLRDMKELKRGASIR